MEDVAAAETTTTNTTATTDMTTNTAEEQKKRKHDEVNTGFDLNKLTVKVLKKILKKKGLDDRGVKDVLIARVQEQLVPKYDIQQLLEEDDEEEQKPPTKKKPKHATPENGENEDEFVGDDDEHPTQKEYTEEELNKMPYNDIKALLRSKGINNKGKKTDLIQRYVASKEERQKQQPLNISDLTDHQIGTLPDKAIKCIFSFLDLKSLLSVSQVCKPFYRYQNDNHIWKHIASHKFPESKALTKKQFKHYQNSIFPRTTLPGICSQKSRYMKESNKKKCLRCNQPFIEFENNKKSCTFHLEDYTYADQHNRDETLWLCCDAVEEDDPGCSQAKHTTVESEVGRKGVVNYNN